MASSCEDELAMESTPCAFRQNGERHFSYRGTRRNYPIYSRCRRDLHKLRLDGQIFPKPTHLYGSVNIYGKNIVSSEGAAWRHHRKLTSPSFGEKNNQLVWKETLDQSQAMLESWVGPNGNSRTIDRIGSDTMQLSMNVISRAGLSQKLEWPKAAEDIDVTGKRSLPNGHTMSFTHSLHCLLSHLLLVMLVPKWILSMLSS